MGEPFASAPKNTLEGGLLDMSKKAPQYDVSKSSRPALRNLVESALREVISDKNKSRPRTREEWVVHLAEALMSDSDAPSGVAFASLMSNGVSQEEIYQVYIPAAARYLGELWVSDRATFVEVTVGASRLQKFLRSQTEDLPGTWPGLSIPLGQSILMVIPRFENHSLGAFVAADNLRRHGIWVHMGISLDGGELADMINSNRFSAVGITLSTPNSVEKAAELVDFVRNRLDHIPPVVVGGRAVEIVPDVAGRAGADFAALSAREVIEKCGLSTMAQSSGLEEMC